MRSISFFSLARSSVLIFMFSQQDLWTFVNPICVNRFMRALALSMLPGSKTTDTNIPTSIIKSHSLVKPLILFHYRDMNKKCKNGLITLLLLAATFRLCAQDVPEMTVSNLQAMASGSTISLSWSLPDAAARANITSLSVFRATKPIYSSTSISTKEPIAVLEAGQIAYTDHVYDTKDYYYAVLATIDTSKSGNGSLYYDEELDKTTRTTGTLYTVILPGVNSTITSVRAASTSQRKEVKQKTESQPLPYEKEIEELKITDTSERKGTISLKAEKKAKNLVSGIPQQTVTMLAPHLFTEDSVIPSGGDDYLLYAILSNTFIKNDYENAIKKLTAFLSQTRNESVTNRSLFYLGESYYFSGEYTKALNKFLKVSDAYPALSRKWIDSCLDCM